MLELYVAVGSGRIGQGCICLVTGRHPVCARVTQSLVLRHEGIEELFRHQPTQDSKSSNGEIALLSCRAPCLSSPVGGRVRRASPWRKGTTMYCTFSLFKRQVVGFVFLVSNGVCAM